MSGRATKLRLTVLATVLAIVWGAACGAADKAEKPKVKDEPKTPAEAFTPTKEYLEKEQQARNFAAEIEKEVEARAVPMPPEMALDVDWYSPFVDKSKLGQLTKGWVYDDLVLLETDKQMLVCVRRADGVERWVCELSGAIRYAPCISRNNVVVNVNNYLVAIHREAGYMRWRLLPNFVMSCAPLVIDPATYPKEYTKDWRNLETVYTGGWDGRFYCMTVRGRMGYFVKHQLQADNFSAPEFDLFYTWHKTHTKRGVITHNIVLKDNFLYYTADDHNVYAVSREGVEREPYYMLGAACTSTTVTASAVANVTNSVLSSVYVGGRDDYLYGLDRLTLKKKWAYPAGCTATGAIFADESLTPYVYAPFTDGTVRALLVRPARASKGQPETPESFTHAWDVQGAAGIVTAGPEVAYLGIKREGNMDAYKGVMAVDKATGKVLWKTDNEFFRQFLGFNSAWNTPGLGARVYAITSDNRLVSLKEKIRETGLKIVQAPVEPEAPKMTIKGKGGAKAATRKRPRPRKRRKRPRPRRRRKRPRPRKRRKRPRPRRRSKPAGHSRTLL
ncbi:MAG: PQQ-binding-like beta-propeller repeat protein [Planctomycetota bacterium]|nr:PQQ-binding-like beta-propeller repeat protein [Planctomycetota bacterium]